MTAAIVAENLSKLYPIHRSARRVPYHTLRDALVEWATYPWRRLTGKAGPSDLIDFWALRDIAFTVQPGEVVGVIGRNGAGKSTLLKILSRIVSPTTGRVTLRGRVGSLLEVGTGFHPELTGRENIELSGAILGMRAWEIRRKFDEIVAFAEMEKFLDTQVKHYSSGMYMRLAFAVAAHLEPEILLIDEVLAVGDAGFQRKCLAKMEQVGGQGRTVLFVSHNMPAVARICPRTILLDQGRVRIDGPSEKVVHEYLQTGVDTAAERLWQDPRVAPGDEVVRLRSVRAIDEQGRPCFRADIRQPIGLQMEFDLLVGESVLVPNFHLYNEDGVCVFITGDTSPERTSRRPAGRYKSTAWIPGNFLSEGVHLVHAAVTRPQPETVHVWERDAIAFHVIDPMEGDSVRRDYAGPFPGVVRPLLPWQHEHEPIRTGDVQA